MSSALPGCWSTGDQGATVCTRRLPTTHVSGDDKPFFAHKGHETVERRKRMTMNQTSPSQPKQRDQSGALAVQDQNQEDIKKREEDFIIQVAKRAKEEWETFHLEHPDIDEETFRQAQRFCVKEWFLQHRTTLADLPALERAEKHFACEVQERAAKIEAITEM